MKSFLEECAADILAKYDNDNSACVVFPNKRTMVYFRKIYARMKNQVSFSGNLFPINLVLKDFLKRSGVVANVADELTALFELYEAFREVFCRKGMLNYRLAEDFNRFFDTGQKISSDFNEIDNYLVDIDQLCHNFADLNELDAYYSDLGEDVVEIIKSFWANFSQDRLSTEKMRYKELWINLPKVYHAYKRRLAEKNFSYSGMNNRRICDLIDQGKLNTRFKTYIFVGFNVLNKAERKIFKHLRQAGKAKFYWDADDYYISDKAQEAGMFMRGYLSDYPDEMHPKFNNNILQSPKNVEYIGVPLQVGQAKSVHQIIREFAKEPGYQEDKTAIVLGDEHLLFPVLHSIPDSVEKINVTMGYPFSETPVYSFMNNCMQLKANERSKDGNSDYYFKDVLSVINHPLVAKLPEVHAKEISKYINDERKIRLEAGYLSGFSNIMNLIFNYKCDVPSDLLKCYLDILSELYFLKNPQGSTASKIENEFIFRAYTSIKSLYNNVLKLPAIDEALIIQILKQHIAQIKIPFESEDDGGIQVIGMMETRNIDFDNVIMLGMNEGVFPKKSENNSFITEGMRLAFELPIVKYKDAVFGYFFYRLFQRAKNVRILYNNVFASNISGEPSRFATQILKEASQAARADSKLKITEKQFSRIIKPMEGSSVEVPSGKEVAEALKPYTHKSEGMRGLSPSALNTYIDCQLKFYLQYIAGIHTEEELSEEGNAADFGSILHASIQYFYEDIKDAQGMITADAITINEPRKEEFVTKAYNEVMKTKYKDKHDISGFESIFYDVLIQYLDRILEYDKALAPFQLIGAEKKRYGDITIMVGNNPVTVNIGGTIDRIDYIPSTKQLRIVDYKTGNMKGKMTFKDVESLFETGKDHRASQAFQVLLYSHVYMQRHPGTKPVPIIYGVRKEIELEDTLFKQKVDKHDVTVDASNIDALTQEFVSKLKQLLEKLFSPEEKFLPTGHPNYCNYCDFKRVCKK